LRDRNTKLGTIISLYSL